ncbi:phage major capsid protein [Psychrobacter sp. JB193]|uniref:phage major capsid protein n=1 Tax=Psychrobacter sp. JB193 TaxID=2024406 RepID=UPI000BAAE0F2|nr:phage major capsid protein [Psychrobacter sp. JB193]PAT64060.1 phage major capsid protein [Psychrobacter sp. JB193]
MDPEDIKKDEVANQLKLVNASVKELTEKALPAAENALKEAKKAGDLSEKTKKDVDELITNLNNQRDLQNQLATQLGEAEQMFARLGNNSGQAPARNRAGDLVIANESMIDFSRSVVAGRRLAIDMPRNALTSFTVNPVDGSTQIITNPNQRLTVRDLLAPGDTESPSVHYLRETLFTNNAAPVAENTTKPYSDIEFEEVLSGVKTVAHLMKIAKQTLDDLPQLRSIINGRLLNGLKRVEDTQLLFGSGVGNNLHGIYTQATAFANPSTKTTPSNSLDLMRLAMLQVTLAELSATGHVMHDIDWTDIELIKDANTKGYLFSNPFGTLEARLWGLPVAQTNQAGMHGNFLTGSFADAAQIFDREDANVVVSTENADDFEKNMVSVRAEERLALAVYRPQAFVKGSLTIAP